MEHTAKVEGSSRPREAAATPTPNVSSSLEMALMEVLRIFGSTILEMEDVITLKAGRAQTTFVRGNCGVRDGLRGLRRCARGAYRLHIECEW